MNPIKRKLKQILFKRKNIDIDYKSDLNLSVRTPKEGSPGRITDCRIKINGMGYGCFLEHIYGYGDIELGNYVSISGPGTILHSECGKILIGSFTSIAENVSIQEFNHRMDRPTTFMVDHNIFGGGGENDVVSKGNIVIEEDVWIGSNVTILSGVTIGRGSVIGAGSVVAKDIPRYSVVIGNPGKVIKNRFSDEKIQWLESLQWWNWNEEKIKQNQSFFYSNINESEISSLEEMLV